MRKHSNQEVHKPQMSETDKRAFVAFYNEHSIIPVSQDLSDPEFNFKRASLYNHLGIPLPSLRGKKILELGPGGGYNATAITQQEPELYVFVDATDASLSELKRKKATGLFGTVKIEIIKSNIFDYTDFRKFDLVLIEGVVPGQTKPCEILQHAGSFVSVNGHLITTATTATSLLSEVCRRLLRPFVSHKQSSFSDQVSLAETIFNSHLKSLGTKTRPTRDWVLDFFLHQWESNARVIFSLVESSQALGSNFQFYGSSPRFLIDDRFYKKIDSSASTPNELLRQQYPGLALALLDYRVSILDVLKTDSAINIEEVCLELYKIHIEIVAENSYKRLDEFLDLLEILKKMLPQVLKPTSEAIAEFIRELPRVIESQTMYDFPIFSQWWGRGQQYGSFTKIA